MWDAARDKYGACRFELRTSLAIREPMRAACPNTADDTAVRNRTPAAPQHPKLSHVTKHVVRDAVDSVAHKKPLPLLFQQQRPGADARFWFVTACRLRSCRLFVIRKARTCCVAF
jgi:hypothetical protein